MKLLPIVVFVVAVALGWLIAGNPAQSAKPAPTASTAPVRDERPDQQGRRKRGPDGVAKQRLAAIRASRDPAARMRATIDLANTLSPAGFADWMDGGWFSITDGAELTLFTKIIEERWINEDPEAFLAWDQKTPFGHAQEILATWAKTDPSRVLEFYKNHPNDSAEMVNLADVARTAPELAFQRLQELAARTGQPDRDYYTRQVIGVLMETSPATLEASLDSIPDKLQFQVETALIGQRMKGAFDDEFRKLQERPDGFKLMKQILRYTQDSKDREAFQKSVFEGLANLPSSWFSAIANDYDGFVSNDNAEQWITADLEGCGFTVEQAKRFRSNALEPLYSKPEIALKLLADVDMGDSSRKNLLGNIFRNLSGNSDKAEKLIAMLGSEDDREMARGFIIPKNVEEEPKIDKPIDNPTDWLTGFAALDPENSSRYSFVSATQNWDAGKLAELSRQFNALQDDSKRAIVKNLSAGGNLNGSPLEADALRFLINNPDPTFSEKQSNNPNENPELKNSILASNYIYKFASAEPTVASDWIATLSAGQPKLWAQKNLYSIWSTYDPAAADEWFGTLPATTRENIGKLKSQ